MSYDPKYVTPSFRDALGEVLGVKKEDQEQTPEVKQLDEAKKAKENPAKAHKSAGADGTPNSIVNVGSTHGREKNYEEAIVEETEETLSEEDELFQSLAEQFTPHIAKLIEEGFTDDEITEIIMGMMDKDEEEIDEEEEQIDEISAGLAKRAGRAAERKSDDLHKQDWELMRGPFSRERTPYAKTKSAKKLNQADKFYQYASKKEEK